MRYSDRKLAETIVEANDRIETQARAETRLADEPLVSVITVTYNHAAYIGRALESVVAQSYRKWEQIVIDDGSTDETSEIIRRCSDRRVRYFAQENQGIGRLFETYSRALAESSGDFIAILEGDDFWPEDRLQRLVHEITRNTDAVMAYGYTEAVDNRTIRGVSEKMMVPQREFVSEMPTSVLRNQPVGAATRQLLKGPFFMPVGVLIRRTALLDIGGFHTVEDHHAVDYATFLQLSLVGSFVFVPVITGYWRRHDEQANSSTGLTRMVQSDKNYVSDFMVRNAEELAMSHSERKAVKRFWQGAVGGAHIRTGRSYLVAHEWSLAKKHFTRALSTGLRGRRLVLALLGLGMSLLHLSPEHFQSIRRFA